jgi:dGTPase
LEFSNEKEIFEEIATDLGLKNVRNGEFTAFHHLLAFFNEAADICYTISILRWHKSWF